MKPVSKSDMDCYKNFEFHEKLKLRFKDEDEERESIHQFPNPAFRLEVQRLNDATVYDCKCDGDWDNAPLRTNSNMTTVRKTSNHYMLRFVRE